MDVVVTRLVKNKLGFCDQHVWALEVLQDLELVLVNGFHKLLRPEPDIIELVHQEEGLDGDLFLNLRQGLGVELLKESHHRFHVCLVLAVEQQRLYIHTALQLHSELSHLADVLPVFVQVDYSSIFAIAK